MDLSTLWYLLATLLILAGLAGVVLPALPGLPLMFGGMLLAAWAGGFGRIGPWTVSALGLLTLLSLLIDLLASALGARRAGAGPLAVWGASLGTLIGLWFGLPGLLLGPFIGALAGELWRTRALLHSTHVGLATWLGLLLGAVLKLTLAFAMLGLFVVAWFF